MLSVRLRNAAWVATLAIVVTSGSVLAEAPDAPHQSPGTNDPTQETEEIQAPDVSLGIYEISPTQLILLNLPIVDPLDKGSTYTDNRFGDAPAAPNALEQAKLKMARAAIEASRAAGTLHGIPIADPPFVASPEEALQRKMDRWNSHVSPMLLPDEAAGVGVDIPSIQEVGPPGMTPLELLKLEGAVPPGDGSEAKEDAEEKESPQQTPAGDGSENAGKEGR